jgi:hypothetical protein
LLRRSALSIAVNNLSIRTADRGCKSSIAKKAEFGEGIVLLFSHILFLLGKIAEFALMEMYCGVTRYAMT